MFKTENEVIGGLLEGFNRPGLYPVFFQNNKRILKGW